MAYYYIATAQAETGDLLGAATTAKAISKAYSRDSIFMVIAHRRAKDGDFSDAKNAAGTISNASANAKYSAYDTIACYQAQAGERAASSETRRLAEAAAKNIEDVDYRRFALCLLATARAEAGSKTACAEQLRLARGIAKGIVFLGWRDMAHGAIARQMARAGELGDIEEWVRGEKEAQVRSKAYLGAANGLLPDENESESAPRK